MKQKIYWKQRREKAIAILGGKCVVCGFNDIRALQIDHINGGGLKENKSIGNGGIIRKILRGDTQDYQLLCANHNWIKKHEKQEN